MDDAHDGADAGNTGFEMFCISGPGLSGDSDVHEFRAFRDAIFERTWRDVDFACFIGMEVGTPSSLTIIILGLVRLMRLEFRTRLRIRARTFDFERCDDWHSYILHFPCVVTALFITAVDDRGPYVNFDAVAGLRHIETPELAPSECDALRQFLDTDTYIATSTFRVDAERQAKTGDRK